MITILDLLKMILYFPNWKSTTTAESIGIYGDLFLVPNQQILHHVAIGYGDSIG